MSSTTFDTCNECGDKFDSQDLNLTITPDGSTRCAACDNDLASCSYCMQSHYIADMARPGGADPMCITCADNYYTCDICDNETHADNLVGWDGAPICFACDETHGADCATCGQRMLATDAREHCKPRKP